MRFSAKPFYIILFSCYFFSCLLVYWRAKAGVFTFDSLDVIRLFDELGVGGFAVNFRDISVRPFLFLVLYSGYAWFGLNEAASLIFCSVLHSFNAVMLTWFISNATAYKKKRTLSILAGLIFLFLPYHTEVVVWAVGNQYTILLSFLWIMIWSIMRYVTTDDRKFIALHIVCFIPAVFTHELSFVFPAIILCVATFCLPYSKKIPILKLAGGMMVFFLPLYLCINKLVLGVWIGHYGADIHTQIHFSQMAGTYVSYLLKITLLTNWWRPDIRDACYLFVQQHAYFFLFLILFTLSIVLLYKLRHKAAGYVVFLFAGFTGLVIPVLNLYFVPWIPIHGDRLGYLPAAFLVGGVLLVFNHINQKIAVAVGIVWLAGSLFFLNKNISSWQQAGEVMHELQTTFPNPGNRPVYILAKADNFRGAYMYRCRVSFPFAERLRILHHRDYTAQTEEVYGFNMLSAEDGMEATVLDSTTIKLEFKQWGNWWWRNTLGATNLDTDNYYTTIDEWGHSFQIHFKRKPKNAIYLYQSGKLWKKVDNF